MEEETVKPEAEAPAWKGGPSQILNFWTYCWCTLLCVLIVPIVIAIIRYLQVKCTVYELTTQRLLVTTGVFSKKVDTLELYRIEDSQVEIPFIFRFFNLGNIVLVTSDASTPTFVLKAIKSPRQLHDQLRACAERQRDRKRVRVMDLA